MSDLPKDVGLCASCNTQNSKLASKCRACGSVLPWAQPKPSKIPKIGQNAPSSAPAPKFDAPGFSAPKTAVPTGGGIDIGGTVTAVGLGFLLFAVCSMCCLPGFFLYRYFNNDESWLQYPCLAGGIVNIILIILSRST